VLAEGSRAARGGGGAGGRGGRRLGACRRPGRSREAPVAQRAPRMPHCDAVAFFPTPPRPQNALLFPTRSTRARPAPLSPLRAPYVSGRRVRSIRVPRAAPRAAPSAMPAARRAAAPLALALAWAAALLAAEAAAETAPPRCVGLGGAPVDWWVILKHPGGYAYSYLAADACGGGGGASGAPSGGSGGGAGTPDGGSGQPPCAWQHGLSLEPGGGPPAATLAPLARAAGSAGPNATLAYAFWNDGAPPPARRCAGAPAQPAAAACCCCGLACGPRARLSLPQHTHTHPTPPHPTPPHPTPPHPTPPHPTPPHPTPPHPFSLSPPRRPRRHRALGSRAQQGRRRV
jgi:hypothetical protein